MAKDKQILLLTSYKHARDTEQDRVREGDKVVNRYGPVGNPWRVERIFKIGQRGQVRFDLVRAAPNGSDDPQTRIGSLAADYQRKGDQ